jgi:hypothetical protein
MAHPCGGFRGQEAGKPFSKGVVTYSGGEAQMAQTKSRSAGRKSTSSRSTRKSSGSIPNRARQSQARGNGKGTAQRVQQTVRPIVSKAKGPALATGAAAAGLAGGMVIASRRSRPKLFGAVPLPRPGGTMESVGKGLLKASENVGQLTEEVRRVREGIEADSKRRSPIEVVLHGLTRRPA